MRTIDYRLYAKIKEAKDRPYKPSTIDIDYELLGRILEAKAKNLTNK